VTKNLLSRAPLCFGRHVKSLVPAAFAVIIDDSFIFPAGFDLISLFIVNRWYTTVDPGYTGDTVGKSGVICPDISWSLGIIIYFNQHLFVIGVTDSPLCMRRPR
jgi:hypothetical protein